MNAARRTLTTTVVDHTVAAAAALVDRWHPDNGDDDGRSLFVGPSAHADEADDFLLAAADLHRAMLFFASDSTNVDRSGSGLVQAHALLDTAMRRLHLELELLLSALSSDDKPLAADDDDDDNTKNDITLRLRAVAEAMMAAGYGKECVSTFKARRRAALAATLRGMLGFSPTSSLSQLNKLTWDQVDARVQSWLAAAPVAFTSVFAAERDLCDGVFSSSGDVADAVLAAIASDQAVGLLAVAEAAVARARRAPERLFRVLDVHDALAGDVMPAILAVFGYKSEVATRARAALGKAFEEARGALAGFEAAIQKETSKATAPGGAVHPLTRYVMNYLVLLADYDDALARICQHQQEGEDDTTTSSPESSSSSSSRMSSPIGWLVQVLMRKLEAKAGSYKAAALRHLFLANNAHYVAGKVRGSSKLDGVLGEGDWAAAQRAKAQRHVEAYVREAWSKVAKKMAGASSSGAEGVEEAVMEAAATQERWVAADEEMGVALSVAATAAVVPAYRTFYRRHGAAVRLTPGDVTAIIGGLFGGFATTAIPHQQQLQLQPQDADLRAQEQLLTY